MCVCDGHNMKNEICKSCGFIVFTKFVVHVGQQLCMHITHNLYNINFDLHPDQPHSYPRTMFFWI